MKKFKKIMTPNEVKIINQIQQDIDTLTKTPPATKEKQDIYLASCAKALDIKAEIADYVENELHDIELLQMKADVVRKLLLNSLGMEKEMGD